MEDPNSTLLPYILEALSRKPELSDTFDNLCLDIEEQLAQEQNDKYSNVRKSIQRALNVGQSLGIISLTNELIRVPFNFRCTGRTAKGAIAPSVYEYELAVDSPPQPLIGTGNPAPIGEKNIVQKRIGHHSPHSHHENNHKMGSSGHSGHVQPQPQPRNSKVAKTNPQHGHHHHHHHNCSHHSNSKRLHHDNDSDYTILPQRHIQPRKRRTRRVTASRSGYRTRRSGVRRKKSRSSYRRGRGYGRRTTYRR